MPIEQRCRHTHTKGLQETQANELPSIVIEIVLPLQTTEEDILAAGVATMSFQTDQQRLQDLSSTLRAETGLWLELYNNVFANVSHSRQHKHLKCNSSHACVNHHCWPLTRSR